MIFDVLKEEINNNYKIYLVCIGKDGKFYLFFIFIKGMLCFVYEVVINFCLVVFEDYDFCLVYWMFVIMGL